MMLMPADVGWAWLYTLWVPPSGAVWLRRETRYKKSYLPPFNSQLALRKHSQTNKEPKKEDTTYLISTLSQFLNISTMLSPVSITGLTGLSALLGLATSLGINCRGSGLCRLASWDNPNSESIAQGLRDALWASTDDNSTTFSNGDHVICVSESQPISVGITASAQASGGKDGATAGGSVGASLTLSGTIHEGGICVFPQDMASGATLDLGTIRGLADALLEHGCATCGSVPIHFVDEGSNSPDDGILTFNYVSNPYCIESCISASGSATNNTK